MQVFGRYARVEKAQVNAIVKSCHQGFSTRKIQEIVSPPGIDQVSSVPVSRIARDLDGQVQAFLLRPIEQAIPYLSHRSSSISRKAMTPGFISKIL